MTASRTLLVGSILFTLLGGQTALAQAQPAALDAALLECLGLTDNLARLTCYDNLARGRQSNDTAQAQQPASTPVATNTAVAPTPTPAPAPAPAPSETAITESAHAATRATAPAVASEPTPVAEFGQPAARVEPDAEGAEILIDRVVEARRVEPTKWLLTLQSGQLWRQSVGKSYVIRPGDTVRISPSSWGSDYRLSVEGRRGYIQVTRQE
jgi:hypothetical protein